MDVSAPSIESLASNAMGPVASAYSVGVARKALDAARTEGEALVRLVDSAGGVGTNVNTVA